MYRVYRLRLTVISAFPKNLDLGFPLREVVTNGAPQDGIPHERIPPEFASCVLYFRETERVGERTKKALRSSLPTTRQIDKLRGRSGGLIPLVGRGPSDLNGPTSTH